MQRACRSRPCRHPWPQRQLNRHPPASRNPSQALNLCRLPRRPQPRFCRLRRGLLCRRRLRRRPPQNQKHRCMPQPVWPCWCWLAWRSDFFRVRLRRMGKRLPPLRRPRQTAARRRCLRPRRQRLRPCRPSPRLQPRPRLLRPKPGPSGYPRRRQKKPRFPALPWPSRRLRKLRRSSRPSMHRRQRPRPTPSKPVKAACCWAFRSA